MLIALLSLSLFGVDWNFPVNGQVVKSTAPTIKIKECGPDNPDGSLKIMGTKGIFCNREKCYQLDLTTPQKIENDDIIITITPKSKQQIVNQPQPQQMIMQPPMMFMGGNCSGGR